MLGWDFLNKGIVVVVVVVVSLKVPYRFET
jgi:hypothetical protein